MKKLVAVLMTCHNRKGSTLRCLSSLTAQVQGRHQFNVLVHLVDDGSTDGTAECVRKEFPQARIIPGSGNLYWAGGMALAEGSAMADAQQPDYLMWLNDDVVLHREAMACLLTVFETYPVAIAVGSTADPVSEEVTYSGLRKTGGAPTRLQIVVPNASMQIVDTFHGNIVLIPYEVVVSIGGIDGRFGHAYADNDFGLRATASGIPVVLAEKLLGTCERQDILPPWMDPNKSVLDRIRYLRSAKGMPMQAHWRYIARHGLPIFAPVQFIASYLNAFRRLVRPPNGRHKEG